MLLFYNSNGDLLKSVLEPVYQGSNNANTIYFIAPISANNVVFLSYILPNGDLGVPKVLTITQPPETLPQESFGNFRVWKIQVDEDLTRYPGPLKVSFLARGVNEQLYHNITFAQLNIEVLASGNFVMPSSPPNDNVYNEILIALGSLQEVIAQNSDDISQLKNDVESLGNDLDEAKAQIEANETAISFFDAAVRETTRLAYNAERVALNTSSELNATNIKVANLEDVVGALSSANLFEIVSSLPTTNINPRVIYLVSATDTDSNNYYEEYIYVNGAWELIGTTKVDLVGIEYDSLINMPIFNSSDGIFGIQKNISRSLQNNDYFKYIGSSQNNLGLEKGLVYLVKIQNGVKSYIPINGDRDYINLVNKPILYSFNGNEYVNEKGELVYINPPCYIKYVGEVFDENNPSNNPHSLTPNIIYFVEEVNNVWTYKPLNASGGTTDVQINGESITKNGVANIPFASSSSPGVSQPGGGLYLNSSTGIFSIESPTEAAIKQALQSYKAITCSTYKYAVKYGLTEPSKLENGVDKNEWTEDDKAAARETIGAGGLFKHNLSIEIYIPSDELSWYVDFEVMLEGTETPTKAQIIEIWEKGTQIARVNGVSSGLLMKAEGYGYEYRPIDNYGMGDYAFGFPFSELDQVTFNIQDTVEG